MGYSFRLKHLVPVGLTIQAGHNRGYGFESHIIHKHIQVAETTYAPDADTGVDYGKRNNHHIRAKTPSWILASMAELVDAVDSKSIIRENVRVRFPFEVHIKYTAMCLVTSKPNFQFELLTQFP